MDTDELDDRNRAIEKIAAAITANAAEGHDASGGCITSLTEAVMGMTAGLFRIAESLDGIAEAIRDRSA